MTEEPTGGSGHDGASGEHGDKGDGAANPVDKADDKVAYGTYKKTVDEVRKLRDKLKESQSKLDEFVQKEKDREEKDLKERQEWKTYAERKEAEYKEQLSQAQEALNRYLERDKLGKKVQSFIGALDGDLDPRFYVHIPDDLIEFKPDSDEVDEMTVTKAVETFRKEYGDLIRKKGQPSPMPNHAPGDPSSVSYEDWLQMSAADKKKHYAAMVKNDKARRG